MDEKRVPVTVNYAVGKPLLIQLEITFAFLYMEGYRYLSFDWELPPFDINISEPFGSTSNGHDAIDRSSTGRRSTTSTEEKGSKQRRGRMIVESLRDIEGRLQERVYSSLHGASLPGTRCLGARQSNYFKFMERVMPHDLKASDNMA